MKHLFALAFLLLFLAPSPSFAADPLTIHAAGFGPEVNNLQLGKAMTWVEMLNIQADITSEPIFDAPGFVTPAVFGVIIADNYKAAAHKWTFEKFPVDLPGQWLAICFWGGKGPEIMNGGGAVMSKLPGGVSLIELFGFLRENGLNYIAAPNITLHGERIIEYSVDKKDLPEQCASIEYFAQRPGNTPPAGATGKPGKKQELDNPQEGWRVVLSGDGVAVFATPIADAPKK